MRLKGYGKERLPHPHPASLTDGLIWSELQIWDSCLRGYKDIEGGAELSGFRVRARGIACAWTEV